MIQLENKTQTQFRFLAKSNIKKILLIFAA